MTLPFNLYEIYDFSLNNSWIMLPTLSLCMYNIIWLTYCCVFTVNLDHSLPWDQNLTWEMTFSKVIVQNI